MSGGQHALESDLTSAAGTTTAMVVSMTGPTGYTGAGGVTVPVQPVGAGWLVKMPIVGWYPSGSTPLTLRFAPFPLLAGATWTVFNGDVFACLMDPLTGDMVVAMRGGDITVTSGTTLTVTTGWTFSETHGTTVVISDAGFTRTSPGPLVGWLTALVERTT